MSIDPINAVASATSTGERASAGISAARAGWFAVETVLKIAASAKIQAVDAPL